MIFQTCAMHQKGMVTYQLITDGAVNANTLTVIRTAGNICLRLFAPYLFRGYFNVKINLAVVCHHIIATHIFHVRIFIMYTDIDICHSNRKQSDSSYSFIAAIWLSAYCRKKLPLSGG